MTRPPACHFFLRLLTLLTVISAGSLQASPIVVDADFDHKLLVQELDLYEDVSGTLALEDVIKQSFVPNPHRVPAFGFAKSTYWYRVSVRNVTDENQLLYLELEISWIDHFSLFLEESGLWVRKDAGVTQELRDREIPSNRATHRFTVPAKSERTVYLRLSSSDAILLPMHLHTADSFAAHVRTKEILYGLFAGIMAVAAFYGLVFFVYTFNKAYLYYFLNTLSWLVMFAAFDGYAQELLFHDEYIWTKRFNVLMTSSSMIWGALFASRILETASYSRTLITVVRAWILIHSLIAALSFVLPYPLMIQTSVTVSLGFPVLLAVVSLAAIKRRMSMARNYLLSWSFPIVGAIFFNGMVVGLVPGHPLIVYALHFTVLLQSLFQSFLLSYHLREATQKASVLQVSVEAAGVAHSALMKHELDAQCFKLAYRYRPCEESGGDVFSCLQDPRGSFSYAVVGDVSGHGITAAIISSAFTGALNAAVKGLGESALSLEDSCRKIMQDMNLVMCDYYARTYHFASAVLVGVDQRNGQMIYINAGHRNIFLKNQNRISALLRGGSLLGFQPESNFAPVALTLTEDDMLLLFTDGLLENDFGVSQKSRLDLMMNSLRAHAEPQSVLDSIWQGIVTHHDRHPFDDDMTLLVIKVTSLKAAA